MKKLILLFAVLAMVGVAQAEMLTNGGFEDSTTTDSPWLSWGSGATAGSWAVYYRTLNTGGGGAGGSSNWLDLPVTSWGTWGWGYNVAFQGKEADGQAALSVIPGEAYTMSAWYNSATVSSGLLGWEWCDDSGLVDLNGDGDRGGVNGNNPLFYNGQDADKVNIMVSFPADGQWHYIESTQYAPTVDGLGNPLTVSGVITVFGGASYGDHLGLDDASLIPEPISIALLGLGGLFLRRRK